MAAFVDVDATLAEIGCSAVRPGDPDFKVHGMIRLPNGMLVNRWEGGATFAQQIAYLRMVCKQFTVKPSAATVIEKRQVEKPAAKPAQRKATKPAAKVAKKKVAKKATKRKVTSTKKGGKK